MIIVENNTIEEIPFLHLVKEEYRNEALPTCFFVHGFTSAKEHNLHYAYYLAEKGFRVILPDCLEHGERGTGKTEYELGKRFWNIVIHTIKELDILKETFARDGLIDEERIGLAGTSMGGIVTLGALTQYEWINSAVSLMGNPSYVKLAQAQLGQLEKMGYENPFTEGQVEEILSELSRFDLSLQPEKLNGRPLMFWHGKNDKVVPFQLTYEAYTELLPFYEGREDQLVFLEDKKADHKVSRDGVLKLVDWFVDHLMA
ncbi:prolyl oligopeptidase family serine peptidase [Rossellomorea marisflavi]|uniref:Prolyl oligopeptidase family serine peptidase n=1 Tax=Rossellomorea marisflavi TaxID=189381 RepID=A0A5D4RWN7_9BACI|nr:alpha/beta fold hydrolase [Rossellomorea marisflavi]KQU60667.1 esterase [Bacillus sp. Leaf406]MDR4937495.1 prolyl oligopeptidase family serine peptidase [Rossellomorea marisflavi]MDW4526167.1 prolyl oligopeptidase family serine peptidase [Rossellomorea marisflavi]TYS54174.1 prolyl oligopeptidase family serine peptidase [Rossellomorea marisflavi]UKS66835.1 prolyl oligopeptidase family serine peptidase [Rossellomorea marisflavi]